MAESKSAVAIVARRAVIETNIERCRDAAAENIVEIGRWLNRAKEENIVPHGEWATWLTEHAGMNERTAQRAMQIARELPEGSTLARLGVAKISSLLTLPAAEREDVASRIDAEHLSSREVDAQVKAIRAERDEALRVLGEQRRASAERAEKLNEAERLISVKESAIIGLKRERGQNEQEIAQLKAQLDDAKRRPMTGISAQAQAVIDSLQAELDRKTAALSQQEKEIDRLTDQLDDAQTAAMRSSIAGTDRPAASTRILSAIGAFTVEAGTAVGELERTAGMLDEETLQLLIGQASLIGQLAMRVIAACGGDADGLV